MPLISLLDALQVITLVNDLVEENRKQWDETQSMKQQVDNISRIINVRQILWCTSVFLEC